MLAAVELLNLSQTPNITIYLVRKKDRSVIIELALM